MHADARNLLWDARRAAERVLRFTHGKIFADYQADELLRSAVERQLEIEAEDFGYAPFDQRDGLGKVHQIFGA